MRGKFAMKGWRCHVVKDRRCRDYGNVAVAVERFVQPRVEVIPEEDLLANLLDVDLVLW